MDVFFFPVQCVVENISIIDGNYDRSSFELFIRRGSGVSNKSIDGSCMANFPGNNKIFR